MRAASKHVDPLLAEQGHQVTNAELFAPFLDDLSLRRRNLLAYIDVRDLGQMVRRDT